MNFWDQKWLDLKRLKGGQGPQGEQGPIGAPSTNLSYVANQGSDNVSVINGATNTVFATITVGDEPSGVGVNPLTNFIYVSNHADDNVSVIDVLTNTVIAIITVVDSPFGVGVNS